MAFRFALAGREVGNKTNGQTVCTMQNELFRLLQNSDAPRITIQMTGEDVMELVREIAKELNELTLMQKRRDEEFLSKKAVMATLGVCDTTLWQWAKNNYLKPVRAGRKVMYRRSDVLRLLESREDRI